MSLKYIVDSDNKYGDELLKHLRAYNVSQVGKREEEDRVFYVYDNQELLASAKTGYSWDWVSPYNFFYQNQKSLFALMNAIVEYYKDKPVGINTTTFVPAITKDLLSYGFKEFGRVSSFYQGKDKVALELRDWRTTEIDHNYNIVHAEEELEHEKERFQDRFNQFVKDCGYSLDYETHQIVCLEGETFVGGVLGYKHLGSMYVSLLTVKEEYRNRGIARKLMQLLEEYAKSEGIDFLHLGTGSFQAKDFYEKLGYSVAVTQVDKPKGHNMYTMVKRNK